MNVGMTRSYAFTLCNTDGGTTIAVGKSRYAAESFSAELETEYRSRIGLEAWGDNNARGDNKVDNKVYNNTRGDIKVDIKVDNNIWDDVVKHSQPRTRTTTPYNTRTRSVQHPYKNRQWRLGKVMLGGVLKHDLLTKPLREMFREAFMAAYNFVAPKHGKEGIGV